MATATSVAANKIVVLDRRNTASGAAKWLQATIVDVNRFLEDTSLDGDIVFDVDLRDVGLVGKLLKRLDENTRFCRIFLADPGDRVSVIHANKLGSHLNLARTISSSEIDVAIYRFYRGSIDDDPILSRSVTAAATSLTKAFVTARKKERTCSGDFHDAADAIVDVIQEGRVSEWLAMVKSHHVGTFQHCLLVTGVAGDFARKLGMSRQDMHILTISGLVHDIGKAFIPLQVLDKPGRLTAEELDLIRRHPDLGERHLRQSGGFTPDVLHYVRSHHEMLDGSGYPDGLAGMQIKDLTRIVTICDIYAALVEQRSYKAAFSGPAANDELASLAKAGKLDRDLVREFVR